MQTNSINPYKIAISFVWDLFIGNNLKDMYLNIKYLESYILITIFLCEHARNIVLSYYSALTSSLSFKKAFVKLGIPKTIIIRVCALF